MRSLRSIGFIVMVAATGCTKPSAPPPSAAPPDGRDSAAVVPDGEALIGAQGVKELVLHGAKQKVELGVVAVQGQPFAEAVRATVKEASNSEWAVQLQTPTTAAVKEGDALLATFYVRAARAQETGTAETQFVFERASDPYTKSVTYPLRLTGEWRKVQVRFQAKEGYAAGQAQVIFRLGYEPQVIEIGGVSVENFGDRRKLADLPTTEAVDQKLSAAPSNEPLPPAVDGATAQFEVAPKKLLGKISRHVYGINSQAFGSTRAPLRRMGGNRQTAYNWELNASSAGSDWQHLNDDWPCTTLGYQNCNEPGAQLTNFVADNRKAGAESLLVIPLLDYVSADKSGPVNESEKAPSKRFVRSLPAKTTPYSAKPDLADGAVYQDELVHFLVQKLGRANQGGVKFYALDNEPALWSHTHPRIHPQPATYAEVVSRSEATAAAITRIDPSAIVLGGVMFGWSEFMSLSNAADAKAENATYGTYVDFFLASMQKLEKKHGRRLVHALDVHWYPENRGTKRVTESDASLKTIAARLEAPRSLWDDTYREKSWIGDSWGKPVRLLPWLKERITERYPGTELAMTEYNFGAGDHISGGLAQVDVLGILGREGVYLANYWGQGAGVGELPPYVAAAFSLYRNYDGQGAEFGEQAVWARAHDAAATSIYAAQAKGGRLTLIVINKDLRANLTAKITLSGAKYQRARPFVLDETSPAVRAVPEVKLDGGVLVHKLPRLSATLFVLEP